MSTENNQPVESVSKSRQRLTRSRVLLGIVGACLLLWSIKTIHHALQPKYQGKTAQEWFAEAKVIHHIHNTHIAPDDPGFLALTAMGTNAVWYIWHEHERENSRFTIWVMDTWRYYILGETISFADYQAERRTRAWILLYRMGPVTECLIPELVSRVDGADAERSAAAAVWLGNLRQSPELSVPALVRALKQSRRIPAVNHSIYVRALGQFRSQAEAALPLLLELHDHAATTGDERLGLASAIFHIDGSLPEPRYINRILDPNDVQKSFYLLHGGLIEHQPPTNAIPALLTFSKSLTNEMHALVIQSAIRKIDPEGLYQKP